MLKKLLPHLPESPESPESPQEMFLKKKEKK